MKRTKEAKPAAPPAAYDGKIIIPERKISETILDFGAPFLSTFPTDLQMETLHDVFQIVILIWNAHVMATPVWEDPSFLRELESRAKSPGAPLQLGDICGYLSTRWHEKFSHDPRAVGLWEILPDGDGGLWFRCDARLPHGILAQH